MEALGAFALAGLGYLVTKLSAGKDVESFDSGAPRGPDSDPLQKLHVVQLLELHLKNWILCIIREWNKAHFQVSQIPVSKELY